MTGAFSRGVAARAGRSSSRILIAWELGGNYGHLGRQLPIARALRGLGDDVLFAASDTAIAAELLTPARFQFVQAPASGGRARLSRPPANYAELLLAEDYADAASLAGRVDAWLSLFRLHKTSVMVADHSPTALLAARIAGIPVVQFGDGFEIPPDAAPLPSIRPWQNVEEGDLRRSEERVVRAINHCMRRYRAGQCLRRLADLFQTEARILATFPELDHYGRRAAGHYVGPLFTDIGAPRPCTWNGEHKPKIFAYLHGGLPGLKPLLEALGSIQADTVCFVSGTTRPSARRHCSKSLRIVHRPVDLSSLLPDADLVVCQANMGITARSLLARLPLLLVPGTAEQCMLARSVERIGAGTLIGEDRRTERFVTAIQSLLGTRTCRDAAARFAARHANFRPQSAIHSVTNAVNRLLGTRVH